MQHLLSLLEESFYDEGGGKLMWCRRSTAGCRQSFCGLTCTNGHVLEEQWTRCAHGQWVTVIEVMIENHSRPVVEVPLAGSGAWTLETYFGLAVFGCSSDLLGV